MNPYDIYRTACALADAGHRDPACVSDGDMVMAADAANAPRPTPSQARVVLAELADIAAA